MDHKKELMKAGCTEAVLTKASASLNLDFAKLFALFQKYGPVFVQILMDLFTQTAHP